MAMTYYSKRTESQIPKGEGQRWAVSSFQSLLPLESHRTHFFPPAVSDDNMCEMLSPGKLIRNSVPRVFGGGCSRGRALYLACVKNRRHGKGERVFLVSHSVAV